MKSGRLMAFIGAAILVSSSAPFAEASAASAGAAVPAVPTFNIPFDVGGGCEGLATIYEYSSAGDANVVARLQSDPCSVGVEAVIAGTDYAPLSNGNDIYNTEEYSYTGDIPASSANHHGIRWWDGSQWRYNWAD